MALVQRLAARAPSESDVVFRAVDMLAAKGRLAAARELLTRGRPYLSLASQRCFSFQREASLYMQEERWGRAIEALQTASRIEPTRADLHYLLADLYERMGSLHAAVDEVRKGRVLDTPEGAKAQQPRLERLEARKSSGP